MEKYITYMCLHGIPVYANVVFGIYNFSAFFFTIRTHLDFVTPSAQFYRQVN